MDNPEFHPGEGAVSLDDKLRFLSRPEAYAPGVAGVTAKETHMSWVFLAGDKAYKLKKPVWFPYLDFSTVEKRERACRAELRLNRRLAPDIYLNVVPLTVSRQGLAIDGDGSVVDWLVVMRRLDDSRMLDRAILDGWMRTGDIDRVIGTLARFYRHAAHVFVEPEAYIARLRQSLAFNRRVLHEPRLDLPGGLVFSVDRAQREFLASCRGLLAERVRKGLIVDGHGDLRPEHIWLGDGIRIIDCLEFNAVLRAIDPLDEIAYLSVEGERLGSARVGERIRRRLAPTLRDGPSEELFLFYRCHRATLRARLAISHLLEPNPRTPEKWPRLARAYLTLAARDACRLRRLVKRRFKRR